MTNDDPNAEYRTLAEAFDHLNAALFAGQLPAVLITLQREKRTIGYYQHSAFASRTVAGQKTISEIALNPDVFPGRTDSEILSTLAHEMCHLWQAYFGAPSRGRYHNAQWAAQMRRIGLEPQRADGRPGATGQAMTHTIVAGGPFDAAARGFLSAARLQWQSRTTTAAEASTAARKRASKTKFTCPSCELNAWAKPDASLLCAACAELMVPEGPDETDNAD